MSELMPWQITGADFLARQGAALLADEQRVGKTGAAVAAADMILAKTILVITTASGRAQWAANVAQWSVFKRNTQAVYGTMAHIGPVADVVVIAWSIVCSAGIRAQIARRKWDLCILDEAHYASNPETERTIAGLGLAVKARVCWALSGTPINNAPHNIFPLLKAIAPERLQASDDATFSDVSTYKRFKARYCVVKKKYYGGEWKDVVLKGKNEDELNARLAGFMLRRTQEEVGITQPVYEMLYIAPRQTRGVEIDLLGEDVAEMLEAAEAGTTSSLNTELSTLCRVTGLLKAHAMVELVKDEFECGLEKIVLMTWHKETASVLCKGLAKLGVEQLTGETPARLRQPAVNQFNDKKRGVFVGQIIAAGELIDLSSATEMIFVEPSFVPAHMAQAAMRITNITQKQQPRVRFAALTGSIDEVVMTILARKVASINKVMEKPSANQN